MTDLDGFAAALSERFASAVKDDEPGRFAVTPSFDTIRDGLNAASGTAVREAWWRRGGELFEPTLRAARRAPHPAPLEAARARHSLIDTGHADVESWTFAPVDDTAALVAIDRANAEIPHDHPLAEAVGIHLANVRGTWRQLASLHDRAVDDDEIVRGWSARWRLPDDREIASALAALETTTAEAPSGARPRRDVVIARFTAALDEAAPGWTVEERHGSAAIASASPEHRVISVEPERIDSDWALERLIAHEVYGHAARSHRASNRPDMLASIALGADAAEIEEAMAMRVERERGMAHPAIERRYAARAIGVTLADVTGIDEVYGELRRWTSPQEAAAIAVRVKRGVRHPGRPGAYSKDVIYYRGGAELTRHLAAHPDDLPVLRATKWGLDAVRRFGGLFIETGART